MRGVAAYTLGLEPADSVKKTVGTSLEVRVGLGILTGLRSSLCERFDIGLKLHSEIAIEAFSGEEYWEGRSFEGLDS